MNLSRKLVRCAVFGLMLTSSAMLVHAQENKDNKDVPKKRAPERQQQSQHTAPANAPEQHERPAQQQQPRYERPAQQQPPAQQTSPAQQPRYERPAQQQPPAQQTSPAQQPRYERPAQQQNPPAQQQQPRYERPVQQQPTIRDNAPSVYRNQQQPAPAGQPGRTFGNQPGNPPSQPGRVYGNTAPMRAPESPRTFTTRSGDVIHRDAGGQVRQVRTTNGTTIYRPPDGPRRVEVVRPGGAVVVSSARGYGYVQRPIVVQNTTIIKRTYIYNGVPQARIYRPRMYNGVSLVVYTPVHYYRPTFYAYAYNPWARPVVYSWGWSSRPWYGYYGGYFAPYPVYASPTLWLTDYLIAATLENAYQERMAERAAAANAAYMNAPVEPMSPEVKQAIADEVRRQIDQERAQGQMGNGGPPRDVNIFADNQPHVFVAGSTLMVNSNMGECTIGEGDVLQMNSAPPPNSAYADVVVLSSRGPDCRRGSRVSVGLQDLQEMYNQMLATVDRGMGDLQARQGQGGLPPLPQGAAGTIDSPYAQAAQPDSNVAGELSSVTQEADRAEQQAVDQAGDPTQPPTLTLGLSIEDVKAIQGDPDKIVDLGAKKIYVYRDLKITFQDGKVSDIQ